MARYSNEIKKALEGFCAGIEPHGNDASFDYCFNYFQKFRETNNAKELASLQNLERSCLQLSSYLASWGMYRGSAILASKSSRFLGDVVRCIAGQVEAWRIDIDDYRAANLTVILSTAREIGELVSDLKSNPPRIATDTLVTKIMLVSFGNVPGFDTYFCRGCKEVGISQTFGERSLTALANFYEEHREDFQLGQRTISFEDGLLTNRLYPKAKLIDMALFNIGLEASNQREDSDASPSHIAK